jgi:hypothetical protein
MPGHEESFTEETMKDECRMQNLECITKKEEKAHSAAAATQSLRVVADRRPSQTIRPPQTT